MRRKDREVVDFEQIYSIMEQCDCCRLGLNEEGGAYILPLNFGLSREEKAITLYFHGANTGKKLDLIRQKPEAGFEMDTGHGLLEGESACQYSFFYRSVIGKGRVSIVEDPGEKIRGLEAIMEHYSPGRQWDFPAAALERIAVIRLEVTQLTCKEHPYSQHT